MAFRVLVTPAAHADLEEQTDYIARESASQDARWLAGAWDTIFSLGESPKRFAVIAESEDLRVELHHSHRIVSKVSDAAQTVEVTRVWSTARRSLAKDDLE